MHLLPREGHGLEEAETATDPGLSPAEFAFLSFTDSDLALVAAAAEARGEKRLRLASLTPLKHPMSVDLLVAQLYNKGQVVLVRLLGGLDYWRYGAEELSAEAARLGRHLILIPGCDKADERLYRLSTVPQETCDAIWRCFLAGGVDNAGRVLAHMLAVAGENERPDNAEPLPMASAGPITYGVSQSAHAQKTNAPRAAIVHYRALSASGDLLPVAAMETALLERGFGVQRIALASTKDKACARFLREALLTLKPDVILNTTSFSARGDDGSSPFDVADCTVLQAILSNRSRGAWQNAPRGLGSTDLAMNVAMPEFDGRLVTRVIGFREDGVRHPDFEIALRRLQPDLDRVAFVAEQALHWARLRRQPNRQKRIAIVLNDYPGAGGRAGHGVGLDGRASCEAIIARLAVEGYDIAPLPEDWLRLLESTHAPLQLGNLLIALQPPRSNGDAKALYHDPKEPPTGEYLAFYEMLRTGFRADAMIHLGAHGTLEWLPGKAVGLSAHCYPERACGSLPVIYPFIVSDPGEAAQAKRRLSAVTIGHLAPPLKEAGLSGGAALLEPLLDEYATAVDLDPRRALQIEQAIIVEARTHGLLQEIDDDADLVTRLDAWLCDIKEMRVKDGLHVYGQVPRDNMLAGQIAAATGGSIERQIEASASLEMHSLISALSGRFVPPGPSGAPSRGRLDVLPTGRAMTTLDPRAAPTPTAEAIGKQAADLIIAEHLQREGDYPRSLVIDAWGSAAIRTGGEELAQALALMGVRLVRETGSDRITGFEVLTLAELGRPRSDITLRISGLYRDIFQHQIILFDSAVQAVAARHGEGAENPLAQSVQGLSGEALRLATLRVFGPAPESYGTGLEAMVLSDEEGDAAALHSRGLGHAYGQALEGLAAQEIFASRMQMADGLIHGLDMHEADVLEAPDYAYTLGGFASVAGNRKIYMIDSRDVARLKLRTLDQELARTVRARATNPLWIAGMMRHGHRGAGEFAQTVDSLFAFAALGVRVAEHQFDMLHQAYMEDEAVSSFVERENPLAFEAMQKRFRQAIERGYWNPRRNAVKALLDGALAA
jgi:cobaltochelatase CobN